MSITVPAALLYGYVLAVAMMPAVPWRYAVSYYRLVWLGRVYWGYGSARGQRLLLFELPHPDMQSHNWVARAA